MDFSLIVKIFLLVKKISPLMKNLHFWTDFDETLRDECTNELLHLPKFRQNRTKIVDFSLIANFRGFSVLSRHTLGCSVHP